MLLLVLSGCLPKQPDEQGGDYVEELAIPATPLLTSSRQWGVVSEHYARLTEQPRDRRVKRVLRFGSLLRIDEIRLVRFPQEGEGEVLSGASAETEEPVALSVPGSETSAVAPQEGVQEYWCLIVTEEGSGGWIPFDHIRRYPNRPEAEMAARHLLSQNE